MTTHFEHEIELAFAELELCGVPRERARSVHNGIDVLATRYRKQDIAYEELLNRVVELEGEIAALKNADQTARDLAELRPCYSFDGLTAFVAKHFPRFELKDTQA